MPERFASPKELSLVLDRDHGLTLQTKTIYAIKRATIARGDRVFVVGKARPSEVMNWLASHPEFRRDHNAVTGARSELEAVRSLRRHFSHDDQIVRRLIADV